MVPCGLGRRVEGGQALRLFLELLPSRSRQRSEGLEPHATALVAPRTRHRAIDQERRTEWGVLVLKTRGR